MRNSDVMELVWRLCKAIRALAGREFLARASAPAAPRKPLSATLRGHWVARGTSPWLMAPGLAECGALIWRR
jgi:hypothetical protein